MICETMYKVVECNLSGECTVRCGGLYHRRAGFCTRVVRFKSIKAHCIVLVERMTRRTDFGPLTRSVCHWQIEHTLERVCVLWTF